MGKKVKAMIRSYFLNDKKIFNMIFPFMIIGIGLILVVTFTTPSFAQENGFFGFIDKILSINDNDNDKHYTEKIMDYLNKENYKGALALLQQKKNYDAHEISSKLLNASFEVIEDTVDEEDSLEEGTVGLLEERINLLSEIIKSGKLPPYSKDNDQKTNIIFNPNRQDQNGNTLAMLATRFGQAEVLQWIMTYPQFNPHIADDTGRSLAMTSVKYNRPHLLQLIMDHPQFNPNMINKQGLNLAIYMVLYNQSSKIKDLAKNPQFNPNIQDKKGMTPAMHAAQKGDETALAILSEMNADFTLVDLQNNTADDLAMKSGHYMKLVKYFHPEIHQKRVLEIFNHLSVKVGLPPDYFNCKDNTDEILSHQKYYAEEDTMDRDHQTPVCTLCLDEFTPGVTYINAGACPCNFCIPCARNVFSEIINQNNKDFIKCNRHGNFFKPTIFKSAHASNENLDKFRMIILKDKLGKKEDFRFCQTPDCINGLFLNKNEAKWFDCKVCGKETFISWNKEIEPIPDPRSDVRPCPHCHKLFIKDNACNHVECEKCGKKWNFLSGINDPPGSDWDLYDKGPRTYRIPGERNQKTGELYDKYKEGVRPSDDLL